MVNNMLAGKMTANYYRQLIKRDQHLGEKTDKALDTGVLRLENLQRLKRE